MDFVVVSDGLAACLAGAMGKPGVVAVPVWRPWPWRAENGRSIWYPSLEPVEQTRASDWASVGERARAAVDRLRALDFEGGSR
jgi:hypothetical protein